VLSNTQVTAFYNTENISLVDTKLLLSENPAKVIAYMNIQQRGIRHVALSENLLAVFS
jgi:hypothetical protein